MIGKSPCQRSLLKNLAICIYTSEWTVNPYRLVFWQAQLVLEECACLEPWSNRLEVRPWNTIMTVDFQSYKIIFQLL